MQAPKLEKVTVNMGVGLAKQDSKMLKAATEQLATIAGQQPSVRRARKSIAAFKLREGMPVGVAVTLRAERSYEFLDRLVSIAIPRIRDFRGLNPRSFDGRGNYSMGVKEQIIFPEIDYDAIDQVRGLDITITTTASDRHRGVCAARGAGHALRHPGPARRATTPRPMPPPSSARRAGGAADGRGEAAEPPPRTRRGRSRGGAPRRRASATAERRAAEARSRRRGADRAGSPPRRRSPAEEPEASRRRGPTPEAAEAAEEPSRPRS